MKRLDSCSTCFEPKEQLMDNILNDNPQWQSKNRDIYFAPCGNHHLFGLFNNGRTPKVVIMGITTSRSAKDNFCSDFEERSRSKLSFGETLRQSCIANTFNSGRPLFHRKLSKIIELSGIHRIMGIESPVTIDERLFRKYVNGSCSDEEKKLLENVYFSQAILCSSCKRRKPENQLQELGSVSELCSSCKRRKPEELPTKKDIDENHLKCLNAQVEILESFDAEADLYISLGMSNPIILSSEGRLEHKWLRRRIDVRCKNFVKITDVGGKALGWNELSLFEDMLQDNPGIESHDFVSKVAEHLREESERYQTAVRNCARQLIQIRDIVKSLVS